MAGSSSVSQDVYPVPISSCAWPCAGFGIFLAGEKITGTQHKAIWARIVTAMVMSTSGTVIKAAPEVTPHSCMSFQHTLKCLPYSSMMGHSSFFWHCW